MEILISVLHFSNWHSDTEIGKKNSFIIARKTLNRNNFSRQRGAIEQKL